MASCHIQATSAHICLGLLYYRSQCSISQACALKVLFIEPYATRGGLFMVFHSFIHLFIYLYYIPSIFFSTRLSKFVFIHAFTYSLSLSLSLSLSPSLSFCAPCSPEPVYPQRFCSIPCISLVCFTLSGDDVGLVLAFFLFALALALSCCCSSDSKGGLILWK